MDEMFIEVFSDKDTYGKWGDGYIFFVVVHEVPTNMYLLVNKALIKA